MNQRVIIFAARERRAALLSALFITISIAAACGVLVGAGAQLAWLAISCGPLTILCWWIASRFRESSVYWSERKNQEYLYLNREES